jgi:hypothetical protein
MTSKVAAAQLLEEQEKNRKLHIKVGELEQKLYDMEKKFIDAVKYSCPEKYMKIFHDHKIQSPEDLDFKLDKLKKMEDKVSYLRGARKDLACFADLLHVGAELYVAR